MKKQSRQCGFSGILLFRKYFILCRGISCATVHTTDESSLYHNFGVNKKSSLRKDLRSLEQAQHVFASYFNASYPDRLLVIPHVALPRRNTSPRSTPRSFATTAVLPARLPARLADASCQQAQTFPEATSFMYKLLRFMRQQFQASIL